MKYEVWFRRPVVINTDPQRRCYDGCNFSEKAVWSEWGQMGPYSREDAESSMKTFSEINPTHQYKIKEVSRG